MAREHCRPPATLEKRLETIQQFCSACGQRLYAAYHTARTITTLAGRCRLTLQVRHCRNPNCVRYHVSYRPEEEGAWALPHGEFGVTIQKGGVKDSSRANTIAFAAVPSSRARKYARFASSTWAY